MREYVLRVDYPLLISKIRSSRKITNSYEAVEEKQKNEIQNPRSYHPNEGERPILGLKTVVRYDNTPVGGGEGEKSIPTFTYRGGSFSKAKDQIQTKNSDFEGKTEKPNGKGRFRFRIPETLEANYVQSAKNCFRERKTPSDEERPLPKG